VDVITMSPIAALSRDGELQVTTPQAPDGTVLEMPLMVGHGQADHRPDSDLAHGWRRGLWQRSSPE
jgi:hypothetical protein